LIIRDESDKWETTLEEINNSNYNYVKLHRASKFFNGHLKEPMPVCLGYDGSIILPFIEYFHNADNVIEEINRIIASVFLGGVYIESVSPNDLSRGSMNVTGYFRHHHTYGGNTEFHHAIGELDAGGLANIKLLDPEMIEADIYINAYNEGHKILDILTYLSPSLFISAFTYFKNHQLRESLTHTWIGIEQVIQFIWDTIIIEEVKQINIPKRRKFMDSQQWNSAHKVEYLFQNKILNEKLYILLNEARFSRNGFIHKGEIPSRKSCYSALNAIIILIEVTANLHKVPFNKDKLLDYISDSNHESIPQTFVPKKSEPKPIKDVTHWREIKPIPGDKNWEGDFEEFEDITLKPIQ